MSNLVLRISHHCGSDRGKTFICLQESERVKFEQEGSVYRLIIKQTLKTDGGEYTCKAVNKTGETSCSANMYITEPKA